MNAFAQFEVSRMFNRSGARRSEPAWLAGPAGALVLAAAASAFGQACPTDEPYAPSEVRTLEGQLVYHDGIRKWFELQLDQPQCGQSSIQLLREDQDWKAMEVLRGCRVRSRGVLDLSATNYLSLDIYQMAEEIEAIGPCERQPPLPDYSRLKPDRAVRSYRVEMRVQYGPGDHPVVFRVTHAGKELHPWQAYAGYDLTGGYVLYGKCGDGFTVDKVFGTPEAHPSHFYESRYPGNMAAFDPEGAAGAGKWDLRLGYTCVRYR